MSRSISTRCSRSTARCAALKTRVDDLRRRAQRDQRRLQERRARGAAGARRQGQGDRRRDRRGRGGAGREAGGARRADAAPAQHPLGGRAGRAGRELQHRRPHRRATPPQFDFEPLDHVALIEKNDWADLSRITQVAGSRTYCLKGRLALLETGADVLGAAAARRRRLHPDDRAGAGRGRRPSSPPAISRATRKRPIEMPDGRPLSRRHRRDRADLAPFGRDHRGRPAADPLRRLFALLPPRGGQRRPRRARAAARPPILQARAICDLRATTRRNRRDWHARLLANAEALLQALEIPYQVVETSTGDMGLGKYPDERHRELGAVASANIARPTAARPCTTGRRGGRTCAGATSERKVRFVHTLNNTALASPRILVPLLENHQTGGRPGAAARGRCRS